MSRRSRFRDMDMTDNGRIDTRPLSPEKSAGMRNMHYDTDGSPIGGVDRYGNPKGSRARRGPADGSSLGNPVTPGLDRNAEMNKKPAATPAPETPETTTAAPNGSQLLKDRQALHAEMKAAGAGGITPEMAARAKTLGVKDSSFRRVASSLGAAAAAPAVAKTATAIPPLIARPAAPTAPATSAAPQPVAAPPQLVGPPRPAVIAPVAAPQGKIDGIPAQDKLAQMRAAAPPAPGPGAQRANANIASMGLNGAVGDWEKRNPVAPKAGPRGAMAGYVPVGPPAPKPFVGPPAPPTPDFSMPQPANIQAVGTPPATPPATPPTPAPAAVTAPSEFQALTTPTKPAVAVTSPTTEAAKPASKWRQVVPPPGPSFTTPEAVQARRQNEIAAKQGQKRQAYNAAWNAQPNLPVVDPDSIANKAAKSVRTFLSGNRY